MSRGIIEIKGFLLGRPVLTSFLVFLIVLIGGSLCGFILGIWAMARETGPCESPCDGAAMAAGFIWSLSFTVSLILGLISSGITWIILEKSRDQSFD